jgi:hypothetical protein
LAQCPSQEGQSVVDFRRASRRPGCPHRPLACNDSDDYRDHKAYEGQTNQDNGQVSLQVLLLVHHLSPWLDQQILVIKYSRGSISGPRGYKRVTATPLRGSTATASVSLAPRLPARSLARQRRYNDIRVSICKGASVPGASRGRSDRPVSDGPDGILRLARQTPHVHDATRLRGQKPWRLRAGVCIGIAKLGYQDIISARYSAACVPKFGRRGLLYKS